MGTKKDELFQAARWFNLIVGIYNIYLYTLGAGYSLLTLAVVNIGVWTFTRGVHK